MASLYDRISSELEPPRRLADDLGAGTGLVSVIAMTSVQLVGFAASTSFGTVYLRTLPAPDAERYLEELEGRLRRTAGGGATGAVSRLSRVIAGARSR
jgi:hypothetical protein